MDRREAIRRTGFFIGGTAFSAAIFSSMTACQSATATDVAAWQPSFLSVEQGKIVRTISDLLIPATDTPGAIDAKVPEYIDLMIKDGLVKEDQEKLQAAFTDFEKKCQEVNGKAFSSCTAEQQLSLLQQLEKEAQGKEEPSFIGAMKEMTYKGFFTSEIGATEVLKYDPVPGNYDGCIPFSDVGGAWAT